MPKLVINLSNTALGYSGCSLAFNQAVVQGYVEPAMDAKMVYGIAIHKFIDTCYKTKGYIPDAYIESAKAFNVPKNLDPKSSHINDLRHMQSVALSTWQMAVLPDKDFELVIIDGQVFTEKNFSIKYYEDDYIIVNLCGTIDRLGKIKGGCYCIRDWKTTSAWDNKGYFKSYELSRQLRLYILSLKLMAKMEPDSILGQIGRTRVGAQINAVFLKPEPNATKWYNSEVFFYDDDELERFEQLLKNKIAEISYSVQHSRYVMDGLINGHCETKWGKCKFWNVCSNNNPDIKSLLLKRDFIIREFNPLNYSGGIEL